jgi:hypothetical protein
MPANRPRRPQQEDKPVPATTKKGKLNNIELIGIGLIFFAILLYTLSKCGKEPTPESIDQQPIVTEELVDSNALNAHAANGSSSFSGTSNTTPNSTPLTANPDSLRQPRQLYVLADSLRLRKSPERTGEVVGYLRYGEAVMDLGEASAMEKLRVSTDEVRTAPWVKIKTKNGQIGWAFGAYLQFYPVPRPTTSTPNT